MLVFSSGAKPRSERSQPSGKRSLEGAVKPRPRARAFFSQPRPSRNLRVPSAKMARELGPKNVHVVHLLIDAGIDSEAIHRRMKAASGIDANDIPANSLTKMSSIAEAYWFAHRQSRDGWTHELDLRPAAETW